MDESPQYAKSVSGLRIRIVIATMVIIGILTLLGVLLADYRLSSLAAIELRESITQQVEASTLTREIRHAVVSEICYSLARKSRIRAALEDDALDLLYPSAFDELRQVMPESPNQWGEPNGRRLQARFYRFLDANGQPISPSGPTASGALPFAFEQSLALSKAPATLQLGYMTLPTAKKRDSLVEVFAFPIVSTKAAENGESIASLVVGFPFEPQEDTLASERLTIGIATNDRVTIDGFGPEAIAALSTLFAERDQANAQSELLELTLEGTPHHVLFRALNSSSEYPVSTEIFVASKSQLKDEQTLIRVQIFTVAGLLVLIGLATSHTLSRRLAKPVEELAEASEEEHEQRIKAEVALDHTSKELERAARFSADASHQLKTPIAIMRLGLEELVGDAQMPERLKAESANLIRQTGRLANIIDDLLLLSRLDAGRLTLNMQPIDLRLIVEELLDDLSILPDAATLEISSELDGDLTVIGDRTYTATIIQNLLENARKYNRANGRIEIKASRQGTSVSCLVGNTGKSMDATTQENIFDRFHRGNSGENVPGYGLGLNLSHELAILHNGELRLIHSENGWTEFELILRHSGKGDPL